MNPESTNSKHCVAQPHMSGFRATAECLIHQAGSLMRAFESNQTVGSVSGTFERMTSNVLRHPIRRPPSATRWVIAASLGAFAVLADAEESTTYKYNARGQLREVVVNRGTANQISVTYDHDATANRLLFTVGASGSVSNGTVTISPVGLVANQTAYGVSLGVTIAGSGSPSGMVTFSKNGVFLGSMFVASGQASILLEDFPLGVHTITANYAGDATHAASSLEFTVRIQNLSWLPGVLELLLSE